MGKKKFRKQRDQGMGKEYWVKLKNRSGAGKHKNKRIEKYRNYEDLENYEDYYEY